MLGRTGTRYFGFGPAMDEILLGKFHEEIGVKFDVEVEICGSCLGLLNVKVKRGV